MLRQNYAIRLTRMRHFANSLQTKLMDFMLVLMCSISLLSSHPLNANDAPKTELDVIHYVETIYQSDKDSPTELINQLEDLSQLSQVNQWHSAHMQASLLQAELLLQTSNFSSTDQLYQSLLTVIEEQAHPKLKVRLDVIGVVLQRINGTSNDLSSTYKKLIAKAMTFEDKHMASSIILNVADEQYYYELYNDAVESFQLAFDLVKNTDKRDILGHILSSMSNTYSNIGDIENALKYAKQAFEIAKEINHLHGMSIVGLNISRLYTRAGDFEKAKEYLGIAYTMSIELKDKFGMSSLLVEQSSIEIALENWQQAINLALRAIPTLEKSGNEIDLFSAQLNLAICYSKLGQFELAEQYINSSESKLEKAKSRLAKSNYYLTAVQVYETQRHYQKAFNALQRYTELQAEMNALSHQQEVEKYQAEFDSHVKETTNQALQAENKLKALQILDQQKQSELRLTIIVLVCFLLLILCLLLINIVKNRNHFKLMALRDHLTGAPNRNAILQYALSRFNEAKHTDMSLSIGIVDLDNFKTVNDNYGHEAGDDVLKSFAAACNETLRGQDRYGRYGGEEWLIIITNTEKQQIETMFQRLREAFNTKNIKGIPSSLEITFSMGVSEIDLDRDTSVKDIIRRADEKLYQAKNNGRNRIIF